VQTKHVPATHAISYVASRLDLAEEPELTENRGGKPAAAAAKLGPRARRRG
jgi:hypothetical protein